jgi:hypothetical protein
MTRLYNKYNLLFVRRLGSRFWLLLPLLWCSLSAAEASNPVCMRQIADSGFRVVGGYGLSEGWVVVGNGDSFVYSSAAGKIVDIVETEMGTVYERLNISGNVLIRAEHGWFRYHIENPGQLEKVSVKDTGSVRFWHEFPDAVLLGAEQGLFRYDTPTNRFDEVDEETGAVLNWHNLSSGVLIQAQRGWFHYDDSTRKLKNLTHFNTDGVLDWLDVPDGVLFRTGRDWFQYSGGQGVQWIGGIETGKIFSQHNALNNLLIGAEGGLFRYNFTSGELLKVGDLYTGPAFALREEAGTILIQARHGLFVYDVSSGKLEDRGGGETGTILQWIETPDEMLVRARHGWFLYAADLGRFEKISDLDTGVVSDWHSFRSGMLIQAHRGWFRYDRATKEFEIITHVYTGAVIAWHDVIDAVLVGAEYGWYYYDLKTKKLGALASPEMGAVLGWYDVPGNVLIHAEHGLFDVVYEPLSTGRLLLLNAKELERSTPDPHRKFVLRFEFDHDCASALPLEGVPLFIEALDSRLGYGGPVSFEVQSTLVEGFRSAHHTGMPKASFRHGAPLRFNVTIPIERPGPWEISVFSLSLFDDISAVEDIEDSDRVPIGRSIVVPFRQGGPNKFNPHVSRKKQSRR